MTKGHSMKQLATMATDPGTSAAAMLVVQARTQIHQFVRDDKGDLLRLF
jgi:hypothetical protein